ncbi:MAG: TorF family putative porin, partial [Methyloceanibacter sp.]
MGGFAAPALAADLYAPEVVEAAAPTHKLGLSATLALTTDYVFRGISQTAGNPAVQGSFDASYGIFYAGIWG